MVEAGELGTIKYARASRLSEHPAWSEWYRRAENSGGGLFDLHLHDIDYLCYLFGKVKQVYAVGRKNSVGCWNHVATSLTFENGMEATAEGILEMPSGFPFTTELNVVGDKKAYLLAIWGLVPTWKTSRRRLAPPRSMATARPKLWP